MALTPSNMLPLGTKAPNFMLPEVTDRWLVQLSDFSAKEVLVVMFICRHCPYVVHVNEELSRLGVDYKESNVALVAISANDAVNFPQDRPESLAEQKAEFGFQFPYLYDETQEVAQAYKAACTPDFYVFNKARELVYRGQLDDSRPGNSTPVTGKSLRQAINGALEGRTVAAESQLPSLGCNIKWKPPE
jgi:peroxiredoxin